MQVAKAKDKIFKISELHLDPKFYPRIKLGWLTAYQYSQAMRSGAVFPPVTIGLLGKKKIVVDGWHRIEAKKILNEEYINGVTIVFNSEKELFAEAVRLNNSHGRPLSVQEKVKIIERLGTFKFSPGEISELVRVPLDKLERFTARTVTAPNGDKIYLKSLPAKASEQSGIDVSTMDQGVINARSIQSLLMQLIAIIESGAYPTDDLEIKELSLKTLELLQGISFTVE